MKVDLSPGEQRAVLVALGRSRGDADDPVRVDRLAAKLIGHPAVEGGWASYQAGQNGAVDDAALLRSRARRLALTLIQEGESLDAVRCELSRLRFPVDVLDEKEFA